MADDPRKLRPLEWILTFMGLIEGGALATFFFRALPENPALLDPTASALVGNRIFQVIVLAAALLTMAAGLAERVSRGTERATTFLIVGNGIAFAVSLLVYFSLAR